MTRRYADEYAGDATLKRLIDDGEEVTAKTVFDLAKDGDELALIVYRHFSQYLGIACANIASVLSQPTSSSVVVYQQQDNSSWMGFKRSLMKIPSHKSVHQPNWCSLILEMMQELLELHHLSYNRFYLKEIQTESFGPLFFYPVL